ncbi:hypothetical protein BGZ51_004027 [Haplosporangium sp. Z 767]|nr:hypothetical protein BGZ51_004027 [Haplosporangium sp. Z 767]KAF9183815.1 hypothetical protein BGZ50_004067 [Haplosporangium sp. Z 11]
MHCHRSEGPGVEVCKSDFALAVDIEVAVVLQTHYEPLHADTLDDARYLTHFFKAPPREHVKLGHGKFDICKQQLPSLMIRCDTGGGKTVYLEALVKANKDSKFVAVTSRRTVADMLEVRLGSENYQDIPPGLIACDSMAVQAESLCRLDMTFYSDNTILILDEISSLIKQMCGDKTMGNMHNLNLQIFERLIRRATRAICLDAHLNNEEVDILKSMRSDFHVINNTFQQQKGDKVIMFDSKWKLIVET